MANKTSKTAIICFALLPFLLSSAAAQSEAGVDNLRPSITNEAAENASSEKRPDGKTEASKQNSQINPIHYAVAGGVGAIVASFVAGIFNLLGKRMDEKKAVRDIAVQLAIAEWKEETLAETARYAAEMQKYDIRMPKPNPPDLPNLDVTVKRMVELSVSLLAKKKR